MLPIVDKPVIQYLVEEAVSAGITDIMIVTGRGKQAIENHFDASYELEKTLVEKGKMKELEMVEKVSSLAHIAYVRQPLPRGDGDALLRARAWIGDEPCLILFGDDLIKWEKSWAQQLIEAFEEKNAPIIALERVSDKRVSSYGIVESADIVGPRYRVTRFLEKPKPEETPSRLGVIGKYIITPRVFDYLAEDSWGTSKDGEIRLADAFARMIDADGEIYGVEMEGDRYDTGDKFGFIKANIDYALDRDDLGEQVKEFLKKRVSEF
jgi:UTP--glucose-1-phosphate uridylyltransferase